MHLRTKGFETSVAVLATHIRRRYKLDRVLLFEHRFRVGQLTGLEADKPGMFVTDASAVESSRPTDTDRVSGREGERYVTLRLQIHPAEPPSPGTVALAFPSATQTQISRRARHMSFVRPPAPRPHLRRLRVRFGSIPTSPAGVFAQTPHRQPNSTQARVLSLVCLQPTPRFSPPTQIKLTAARVGRVSSRALVFL